MIKNIIIFAVFFITLAANASAQNAAKTVRAATSSSLYDTGLLNRLKPLFEKKSGYTLEIKPLGSGQALKALTKGEADLAITNNPSAEQYVIQSGYGKSRIEFAYNYYILLGPPRDPAGAASCNNIPDAMKKIYSSQQPFISRGDYSAMHAKELTLWKKCGIVTEGLEHESFYLQSGKGIAQTLLWASEKSAYTIADSAIYAVMEKKIALKPVIQESAREKCVYSVILPDHKKLKNVNRRGADKFANFLTSAEIRKEIELYGQEEYGRQLYYGINPKK